MSDEVCPNCEAPFSDLQMMGVGGNQASPRFQCGSIFVPVANRLAVKTYACMKIAELRASIANPAAVPEAVAKDAARYRWLRSANVGDAKIWDVCDGPACLKEEYRLDDAIDAALLSAADTEVKNG